MINEKEIDTSRYAEKAAIDAAVLMMLKPLDQRTRELVEALQKAGVDPVLYDSLITSELERRLKKRFGYMFIAVTTAFTSVSYLIVVLNSTRDFFQKHAPNRSSGQAVIFIQNNSPSIISKDAGVSCAFPILSEYSL